MSPAEKMQAAALAMHADADAAEAEMHMHPRYWGTEATDAAYAKGVNNGLGGMAGAVAMKWTPGMIHAVADWLQVKAANPGDHDHGYALTVARTYLGGER